MRHSLLGVVFAVTGLLLSRDASAQGALVHGAVSAAVANGDTAAAVSGGVAYRFNRALGLGVEFSRHFDAPAEEVSIYRCCGNDWRVTSFTTNVRLEVPTVSTRVVPFVIAGGGVAAVTRSYGVVYFADLVNSVSPALAASGLDLSILPGPTDYEYTTTAMALTLGGGASLMLSRHTAVDIDLRAVHLLQDGAEGEATIGRFGVGFSYRF